MHYWLGDRAFSPFQYERLKDRLKQNGLQDVLMFADILYCLEGDGFSLNARKKVDHLLRAKQVDNLERYQLFVMPRLGTLSPWSSKTSDVALRCGLDELTRIEKGLAFHLNESRYQRVGEDKKLQLHSILHDPLTESLVFNQHTLSNWLQASDMQNQTVIELGTAGLSRLQQVNLSLGLALTDDEMVYL